MKIILSRKGFDSSTGGMPSPILPDGTLLSLPIPGDDNDNIQYKNLRYGEETYADIIDELKSGMKSKSKIRDCCHLDPDLRECTIQRDNGWKPSFGQSSAALTHLNNNGIKKGDLFLFFGWFRQTERNESGKLRFVKKTPDLHILYGYLEIGEIINNPQKNSVYEWLNTHPHANNNRGKNNAIFIATDKLSLNNSVPGGGCFSFSEKYILTKTGMTRGCWNLPDFFRDVEITYHNTEKSWRDNYFKSAGRGQEFVLTANDDIEEWVMDKIDSKYIK